MPNPIRSIFTSKGATTSGTVQGSSGGGVFANLQPNLPVQNFEDAFLIGVSRVGDCTKVVKK